VSGSVRLSTQGGQNSSVFPVNVIGRNHEVTDICHGQNCFDVFWIAMMPDTENPAWDTAEIREPIPDNKHHHTNNNT